MIEEALEARVIEETEQAGRYRFTHAQMQETLLAELSTTRRVRLHGQVGEALERRYGARAEQRAGRLAVVQPRASHSRRWLASPTAMARPGVGQLERPRPLAQDHRLPVRIVIMYVVQDHRVIIARRLLKGDGSPDKLESLTERPLD